MTVNNNFSSSNAAVNIDEDNTTVNTCLDESVSVVVRNDTNGTIDVNIADSVIVQPTIIATTITPTRPTTVPVNNHSMQTRAKFGNLKRKVFVVTTSLLDTSTNIEPSSYSQASKHLVGLKAKQEEYNTLIKKAPGLLLLYPQARLLLAANESIRLKDILMAVWLDIKPV